MNFTFQNGGYSAYAVSDVVLCTTCITTDLGYM